MIVKIYRVERGKNKKRVGEERRGEVEPLQELYFITTRILESASKKWKEMVRIGQDQASPLFCPS
jgi:hypothetical protein